MVRPFVFGALLFAAGCSGSQTAAPPVPQSTAPGPSAQYESLKTQARAVALSAGPVVGTRSAAPAGVPISAAIVAWLRPNGARSAAVAGQTSTRLFAVSARSPRAVRRPQDTTCYYLVTYDTYSDGSVEIVSIDSLGCIDTGGGGGGGGGDGGGAPAPTPDPGPPTTACPTENQSAGTAYAGIGSSSSVFGDIGSDTSAPYGKEASGYIYSDGNGNFKYDPPTVSNLDAGGNTNLPREGNYAGWTTVGYYHTHPHQPGTDPTQTENGLHFSSKDITALGTGQTGYVAVLDSLGTVDATNPQVRFYSYSNGTEKLLGTVGSGGC